MWWIALIVVGVILLIFTAGIIYFLNFGIVRDEKRCGFYYDRSHAEKYVEPEYLETVISGSVWIRDAKAEDIYIKSFDGLRLHARLIVPDNPVGTFIMCHGYRSSGYNDFADFAQFIYEKGYRLLIIDQRASNGSEGRYIGLGVLERYDCQEWTRLIALRHPKEPIFLDGVSMGAATVLMTTGLDLPAEVRGVIADCGFTSPKAIFGDVMHQMFHLPKEPIMSIMSLFIRIVAKYDAKYSTVDALKENKLPLLIVHGEADDFVPHYMSEQNVAAAKNCEVTFISVPNAKHARSYVVDMPRCRAAVTEFLEKYTNV